MDKQSPSALALGLRAQRGGAIAVALSGCGARPERVWSGFVATAAAGDRLAYEPYTVAFETYKASPQPDRVAIAAVVDEALRRQEAEASAGLTAIRERLGAPFVCALLVNRAGWVEDRLGYSLAYADHAPVAEGLAVRDALRRAAGRLGLRVVEEEEKALLAAASDRTGLGQADLDDALRALGQPREGPWRREHRLAALAAWSALAPLGRS
jgi:hypothetical protein